MSALDAADAKIAALSDELEDAYRTVERIRSELGRLGPQVKGAAEEAYRTRVREQVVFSALCELLKQFESLGLRGRTSGIEYARAVVKGLRFDSDVDAWQVACAAAFDFGFSQFGEGWLADVVVERAWRIRAPDEPRVIRVTARGGGHTFKLATDPADTDAIAQLLGRAFGVAVEYHT